MDARRRATEREADARDPHAAARVLVERVRAGELRRERLVLLALAGHPGLQPLLAEDLAEWCAFHDLPGALDLVLGAAPATDLLADWVYGLATLDPASGLRALVSAYPAVTEAIPAREPDPELREDPYYAYEWQAERETALQLVNACLLAVMNWEATRATPLLRGELRRAAENAGFLYSVSPPGLASLFEVPAELLAWRPSEDPDVVRRRRDALQGLYDLLQAFDLELSAVYAAAQRAVLGPLLRD